MSAIEQIKREKKDVVFVTVVLCLAVASIFSLITLFTPDNWLKIKYGAPIIACILMIRILNKQYFRYRQLDLDVWRVNRGLIRMYDKD